MEDLIEELEFELCNTSVPTNVRRNISLQRVRSITFGQVIHRGHGKGPQPSRFNAKLPKIWSLLQELGKIVAKDIPWKSIQLNHNVVCQAHTDGNNAGLSVVISFGKYTGNNIVIDNKEYNTFMNPVTFDGRDMHYNTPQLSGDKYSLVFF